MFDPELEAIVKSTELLTPLGDESKRRVLQYLAMRFQLLANVPLNQTSDAFTLIVVPTAAEPSQSKFNDPQLLGSNLKYPVLRDVVHRRLPKTEVEWILIYCFYASEFGKKDFTREGIIAQYENSKRWGDKPRKSLSANISGVINKQWIESINDKEYIITEIGTTHSNEILQGTSTTQPRKQRKQQTKKSGDVTTENSNEDIE